MGVRDLFAPLLGHWTGLEEQADSRWAPGGPTRAALTFKLEVADTLVVQDYRQVRANGTEFCGYIIEVADVEAAATTRTVGDVLWRRFLTGRYRRVSGH